MRDNVPGNFNNMSRVVGATLTLADERPSFSGLTITEKKTDGSPLTLIRYYDYCWYPNMSLILRYGLDANGAIWRCGWVPDTTTPDGGTITCTWDKYVNGPPLYIPPQGGFNPPPVDYRDVTFDGETYWYVQNCKLYKYDLFHMLGWVEIADFSEPGYPTAMNRSMPYLSIANAGQAKIVIAAVYHTNVQYDHCKLHVYDGNVLSTWEGYLPKCSTRVNVAAVCPLTSSSITYIYVDNFNATRPMLVKFYSRGVWSASKELLPTDALDDLSTFSVGRACAQYNFPPLLTGVFSRSYGATYSAVMLGPDKFTFGRDLIIKANSSTPYSVSIVGNYAYGMVFGSVVRAPAVGIFFDQNYEAAGNVTGTQVVPSRFSADFNLNGSDQVQLDIPYDYVAANLNANGDHTYFKPGSKAVLQINDGSTSYTLGKFAVERVQTLETPEGLFATVDLASYAMKRLLDWQSDTYFDYSSQDNLWGNPGDLTKVVRSAGSYKNDGGLKADFLNLDGILYTTARASHGCFIKTKFINVPNADVAFGVGANYGSETLAEAAKRLGKKVEDTTDDDRTRYGVFAIYCPDSNIGGNISLYSYNSACVVGGVKSPWNMLNSVGFAYPAAGVLHLAIQYQDGYARVYTATDISDNPVYTLAISDNCLVDFDLQPVETNNYGRGSIYMNISSGAKMCYPHASDSDVIPLYTDHDMAVQYGNILENNTAKFLAANGTVKIDSEEIYYTGSAGFAVPGASPTTELAWQPGKIVSMNTSTFAVTGEHVFAQTRLNNYIVLEFDTNLPAESYLTGLRFWAKKFNYPEDGLEVSVYSGNALKHGNIARPLGENWLASGSISSDKISSTGGPITCLFNNTAKVNGVNNIQVVISRARNPQHPDATNYYTFGAVAASAGVETYIFAEEEPDSQVMTADDLAYQLYARIEAPGKEYAFPVVWDDAAGLSSRTYTDSAYNGFACAVTEGGGVNNAWRIVRTAYIGDSYNNLLVMFLDRDPGKIFDEKTRARMTQAFYGLIRAYNGTLASAHGGKVKVHRKPAAAALNLAANSFLYFSADEDLTVAEIAQEIARKAGVSTTLIANRAGTGQITFAGPNPYVVATTASQNQIATFNLLAPLQVGQTIEFQFVNQTNIPTTYPLWVTINKSTADKAIISISSADDTRPKDYYTTHATITLNSPIAGEIRLSAYDGHVSLWIGGRLIVSCKHGNTFSLADHQWTHFFTFFTGTANGHPGGTLLVPEAGTRIETFILDMGKTGAQLLSSLIGNRRVFFRDDRFGRLRIFTDRPVRDKAAIYKRANVCTRQTSDMGLATRILVEGVELAEVAAIGDGTRVGNLAKYGNLFKTVSIPEILSPQDAQYYAGVVLNDMTLNLEQIQVNGPADPVIEPGDLVWVETRGGVQRQAVVDRVSHTMSFTDTDAIYDMQLSGREVA